HEVRDLGARQVGVGQDRYEAALPQRGDRHQVRLDVPAGQEDELTGVGDRRRAPRDRADAHEPALGSEDPSFEGVEVECPPARPRAPVLRARASYSDPADVFDRAKAAGMDYVAITDHDSIEGALRLLDERPDRAAEIIVGEEVETRFPDTGQRLHVNVFGLDE